MTTAERDLVDALRAELAAVDPPRRCCREAEAAGLTGVSGVRRRMLARVALRLRGRPVEAVRAEGEPDRPDFRWDRAPEHCRAAYLRGRFLAHGSLSLASGRTHLEFVLPAAEARTLWERLAGLDLPAASWRLRRGRGVVTWKSRETIGTFLRLIGAGSALLELEARQVARSVRGDLNRVINAESANLERTVAAAARQIEAIDSLAAGGLLEAQPYGVRLVADARREEPEATLTELAERLQLHRSTVQRALERLERLALHADGRAD
jgi:DNA-binding transcriptional regulator WhiA